MRSIIWKLLLGLLDKAEFRLVSSSVPRGKRLGGHDIPDVRDKIVGDANRFPPAHLSRSATSVAASSRKHRHSRLKIADRPDWRRFDSAAGES